MTRHHAAKASLRRGSRIRTRGQSLVEFALVLPIFLVLLSGMVDFGMALYTNITLMNATREGARLGIIAPDATSIESRVRAMATGLNQADLTVSTTCREQSGSSWIACTAPLWQPGDSMVVTADYTYHMIWPLAFGNSIPLTTKVEMRIE